MQKRRGEGRGEEFRFGGVFLFLKPNMFDTGVEVWDKEARGGVVRMRVWGLCELRNSMHR